MKSISILAQCALLSVAGHAAGNPLIELKIDEDSCRQTIDCFGASDAWSMTFIEELPEQVQLDVAEKLFSQATDAAGNPKGIGLSLWRYNIGAGSAEQGEESQIKPGTRTECFRSADGTYNWSKQSGPRKFLRLAREHGVPYLLGFLNSPPVFFTENGLATNTGRGGTYNLRKECYDSLACFIADVAEGLKKHDGIMLDYISPVNEPDGHWNWLGPKQEGTPATNREIARLARLIDAELLRRNLPVKMIIPESSDYRCMTGVHETGSDRGYEIRSFFSPDSASTYVGDLKTLPRMMAGHSYWTNTPVEAMRAHRLALRDTLKKYDVDFWQSEVCIMSNDEEIGGGHTYDRTMKTALYVARMIHHDLVYADARSWQWWRSMGGDYKDGLLFRYRPEGMATDTVVDSRLLWALGNYSRFVRPGAVRVDVRRADNPQPEVADSATDPWGLMCSAYRNADGSLVIVAINYGNEDLACSFDAERRGGWTVYRTSDAEGETLKPVRWPAVLNSITLPARSVTTIVGDGQP